MLDRLLGLETEYAIRFTPQGSSKRPRNDTIYHAIAEAVGELVHTRPGERRLIRFQIFTENGGALCYEYLPIAPAGGLIEGATPECGSPSELLLYQRAQETLLERALPLASVKLSALGYEGTLGLLKNCRDAEGHVYGAQENYEVELATGAALLFYRIGLALLMPFVLLQIAIAALTLAAIVIGTLALGLLLFALAGLTMLLVPRWRSVDRFSGFVDRVGRAYERIAGRPSMWLELLLWWPIMTPFAMLLRRFAFRGVRVQALGFLLSRPILTGCGSVESDGRFGLSEKGPSIGRLMRFTIRPEEHAVFDTGNLMKLLIAPVMLRARPLFSLFRRRQRLQLGLSDSNLCQVAEYLKIGTTSLVLDLLEAGRLRDAPRLERPLEALATIIADPTLQARVGVVGRSPMSALEIQRAYLQAAQLYLKESGTASLEAREIVRLWAEALDLLENDRSSLVGRIDWVTKRSLLERCGSDSSQAALKKLDLRYHELGSGYQARLERIGVAPQLVRDDEVERALREPPSETPASIRGRLIRSMADSELSFRVAWDSVRIGGPLRGKVVRLDDWRGRGGRESGSR